MTSDFKKFICSISFLALLFSVCSTASVHAKEQILNVDRVGFSIWIPEKPIVSEVKDNMEMYVVKRNKEDKKGFIIVVTMVDKSKRQKIDKHYLDDVVEGEQYGFQKKAKSQGKKVDSEFIENTNGSGWTGIKYRVKIGDNKFLKLYGICDKGVFVLTAANQDLKDKVVGRVFDSIKVSNTPRKQSPSI